MVDHSPYQRLSHAVREAFELADLPLNEGKHDAIVETLLDAPPDLLWLALAERGLIGEDRFMLHGRRVVRRYEREVREQ